jgi:4-hydroxybenzoate polyprenyltransferase and related prenyltransferases
VVPLLTAHQLANVGMISDVIVAFISFGLCASATYLLNDMFDLEADRKHRTKCRRPLAAGTISIPAGVLMFTGLMAAGLGLAVCLNLLFVIALLVYLFLTIIYSFKLKRLQTVDVIVLASLFTIRVIAGGAAISVPLSFWLLCFSMFLFLSLAIVKRVSELIKTAEEVNASEKSGEEKVSGRGYYISDLVILQNLGGCSAFMSVLVLAFYINSDEVVQLYRHPEILWLICPIIGYWVMRVWMLTARGQMNEDPISFAIVDKNSWYAGGLVLMVLFVAGLI